MQNQKTKINPTELATAIYDAVCKAAPLLATGKEGVPVPTRADAVEAIAGCLHTRNGTWRRTKPTNHSANAQLLWELVKWHGSGGSMWGYPMYASEDIRDRLDSLAIFLRGGKSTAADAWQRALRS